jgi:hypothetical protein
MGRELTHAPQQTAFYSITSSAKCEKLVGNFEAKRLRGPDEFEFGAPQQLTKSVPGLS